MFSDVQLKRQILTCFTALGKLSTVTLCLTDLPPLGRRRLQNPGEYRFLSVLHSLWLDCPKIMLLFLLFKAGVWQYGLWSFQTGVQKHYA